MTGLRIEHDAGGEVGRATPAVQRNRARRLHSAGKRLLQRGLHIRVEAGDEVVAGLRRGLLQRARDRTEVVDGYLRDARLAAQELVVLRLETAAADVVAAPAVLLSLGQLPELLRRDRAEVAENMTGQCATGRQVRAHSRRLCGHAGEVLLPVEDLQSESGRGSVVLELADRDRFVRRAVPAACGSAGSTQGDLVAQLLVGHLEQFGEAVENVTFRLAAPAALLPQQRDAVDRDDQRCLVCRPRLAVVVDNDTARSGRDDVAYLVVGGSLLVLRA